ncbi:MAG: phosphopentomutase [Melioribacteraceae bacterium]|nr:phosphopentomutase [Melioribacteraceae bacterium]
MKNFVIIILDGVGIGELPDAGKYGDSGSNTLANLADHLGGLFLPKLQQLGLGNISRIRGIPKSIPSLASYGKMKEVSPGKDSTTGHWEIGGLKVDFDFPYYPEGFPAELVNDFIRETGIAGVLGNKPASGTAIIEELGDEHVKTGFPIIYTSADSVFQIAAHEEVIPLERLYEICAIAREKVLIDKNSVGRVIARPFTGKSGEYTRTTNRKDFSMEPTGNTILNYLYNSDIETVAIGKINDLFNHSGIKTSVKTKSNNEGVEAIKIACSEKKNSLIFANLVDFDVYYGHRNDPEGFNKALQEFDENLPGILDSLDENDCLIITADHGNDPTSVSTDHSREYVPLLFYRKNHEGRNLGTRETFSDVAQTVAHFFRINNNLKGTSFLYE